MLPYSLTSWFVVLVSYHPVGHRSVTAKVLSSGAASDADRVPALSLRAKGSGVTAVVWSRHGDHTCERSHVRGKAVRQSRLRPLPGESLARPDLDQHVQGPRELECPPRGQCRVHRERHHPRARTAKEPGGADDGPRLLHRMRKSRAQKLGRRRAKPRAGSGLGPRPRLNRVQAAGNARDWMTRPCRATDEGRHWFRRTDDF